MNLEAATETYLSDLHRRHATGAATAETSYYGPLETLLNTIGGHLKPKVLCLGQLRDAGAGRPDFGLFAANQCQRGEPREGAVPERGVVEVKGLADDAWKTIEARQVSGYWQRYRMVLVTNYRDFLLLGEDEHGQPAKLETFSLAASEQAFWQGAATPRATAHRIGRSFGEYLTRALTQNVSLGDPKDVAWFLASYARDALGRVEDKGDLPALKQVRQALEAALGISFEGRKGDHFFHSTLVQTLFYGVFSAWVLWARDHAHQGNRFDWRLASWYLKVPMLSALFGQLAQPNRLGPLHLVEVLDWTAQTLSRVNREIFFTRFEETQAVQYFYEPFLAAFDPELRKELGVWYTPIEVVSYMVERTDRALREDLEISDGLADERVHVLDPCCGTGSYLAEVLRRIDRTLGDRGLGALKGHKVKEAALKRVHGFEIMPAPFVVSHLQIGLLLQGLQAPLAEDGSERASIYLTNALTGWLDGAERQIEAFPEFAAERELAAHVKREARILVVIGNPPYNGFAGIVGNDSEERALTTAYRNVRRVRPPEGQGLNDLYVRFFRMAERRVIEMTKRGIICFISNYSWLDGLSFTGMRERYLEVFDVVRIDNLHGDRIISEYAPDGRTSETIFATRGQSVGIKIGTAVSTLVSKGQPHELSATAVLYRDFDQAGAAERRIALSSSITTEAGDEAYQRLRPHIELGLPFKLAAVGEHYFEWANLPDLFPTSFPGVTTSRDEFLIDVDKVRLDTRLKEYFDQGIKNDEISMRYPAVMTKKQRFDPCKVRDHLIRRGFLANNVIRFSYRPFDDRWLYWEPETKLLDEKRSEYFPHVFEGNIWLEARERQAMPDFNRGTLTRLLADSYGNGRSSFFPLYLKEAAGLSHEQKSPSIRPNLTRTARNYLDQLTARPEDLFFHIAAILHAPAYRNQNSGALRSGWPKIPLPRDATILRDSSALGHTVTELVDTEADAIGIAAGQLRPELRALAVPTSSDGAALKEMALTAGWGYGTSAIMPAQGKVTERSYQQEEHEAMAEGAAALGIEPVELFQLLGETTCDVWLNDKAYWANIPKNVWRYKLGGYQVIKKWLSYREKDVLGRALRFDEVLYVTEMARRIAAILLMGPELDANYRAVVADAIDWQRLKGSPQPDARVELRA